MKVITEEHIVKDYYISKDDYYTSSLKRLKNGSELAGRLVDDRKKYLKKAYIDLKYVQSDLKLHPSDKNKKRVNEQEHCINYTLENLKVENEDLKLLKNMITEKEWEICCKDKNSIEQISIF